MWILIGLFALPGLPLLFGYLRDVFGWNRNKFYGDIANKQKPSPKDQRSIQLELNRAKANRHFQGGNGFDGHDD